MDRYILYQRSALKELSKQRTAASCKYMLAWFKGIYTSYITEVLIHRQPIRIYTYTYISRIISYLYRNAYRPSLRIQEACTPILYPRRGKHVSRPQIGTSGTYTSIDLQYLAPRLGWIGGLRLTRIKALQEKLKSNSGTLQF